MKKDLLLCTLLVCATASFAQSISISFVPGSSSSSSLSTIPFCGAVTLSASVQINPGTGPGSSQCSGVQWYNNLGQFIGSGSSITFYPGSSGSVNAKVLIGSVGNCTSTVNPPGQYTSNSISYTVLAQDIHIDGPTQVCTGAGASTFTVGNLPPGTSITWGVSGNLSLGSGQSTPTVSVTQAGSGSGSGTVTATVGAVCSYTPPLLSENVTTGVITPNSIQGIFSGKTFAPNTSFGFGTSPTGGTDWLVGGGTILGGQGTNFIIVQTVNITSGSVPLDIRVRENNACGVSPYFEVIGTVVAGGSGPKVIMHPNPASGLVTITAPGNMALEKTVTTDAVAAGTKTTPANTGIAIGIIRIFDVSGRLRKTIDKKAASLPLQLDVSDLSNGIYFVEIQLGSSVVRQKLAIKH